MRIVCEKFKEIFKNWELYRRNTSRKANIHFGETRGRISHICHSHISIDGGLAHMRAYDLSVKPFFEKVRHPAQHICPRICLGNIWPFYQHFSFKPLLKNTRFKLI